MATVLDVGQSIYDQLGWVDAWKLQKLTYYVQAWSLAWDGDPIFEEHFQAWPDGPVSPDLHRQNKFYRDSESHIIGAESDALSQRQREVIAAVLDFYGSMEKAELIDLTHRETPWQAARGNLGPTDYSKAIVRTEAMRSTYSLQALCMTSVPKAPLQEVSEPTCVGDDVLFAELGRWTSTLDWLATR